MKKPLVVLLHLGFWLSYAILVFIVLGVYYRTSPEQEMEARIINAFNTIFLFALLPSAISFYSFYYVVFPTFLRQKKYTSALIIGVLCAIVAAAIGYLLLRYCINSGRIIDMDKKGASSMWEVMIFMTLIGSLTGTVALVIRGFITWLEEIRWKEELQQKNHQMELALVKAQLDPHFLFNTLNNIDVLICRDAELASSYLNKLSDILRFMLYETKTDKILLVKEIEYIEKYLELQKIRTSNSSYVHFSVKGNPASRTIVPLLFIPFIENAFKHSPNKKIENAISISLQIEKNAVQFVCENFYDSSRTKQESSGIGNELIQKRLDLLYFGKYVLESSHSENLYRISLSIYD